MLVPLSKVSVSSRQNSLAQVFAGRGIFRFTRLAGGFEQRDGRGSFVDTAE